MALADYYEGQPVGQCPETGATLVRTQIGVTPDGDPVWDVRYEAEQPQERALAS